MKSVFKKYAVIILILAVGLFTQPLEAGIIHPSIEAQSSATQITEGVFTGWYKYQLEVHWNLSENLSYFDLILKRGCAASDHIIVFGCPAGQSGDNKRKIYWLGDFDREGDKSFNPDIINPVVKYEPFFWQAGKSGSGTFYFISNIIPEYNGPYPNTIVAKTGSHTDGYGDLCYDGDIYGTLYGAYPSCKVIPEPATIFLLGSGLVVLIKSRRGKKQRK